MNCLIDLLLFNIPIFYYYSYLNLSRMCCPFSRNIHLSFGISVSLSNLFCWEVFQSFVMLFEILFPIRLTVASVIFSLGFFEAVLFKSGAKNFGLIKTFLVLFFFQVLTYIFT